MTKTLSQRTTRFSFAPATRPATNASVSGGVEDPVSSSPIPQFFSFCL